MDEISNLLVHEFKAEQIPGLSNCFWLEPIASPTDSEKTATSPRMTITVIDFGLEIMMRLRDHAISVSRSYDFISASGVQEVGDEDVTLYAVAEPPMGLNIQRQFLFRKPVDVEQIFQSINAMSETYWSIRRNIERDLSTRKETIDFIAQCLSSTLRYDYEDLIVGNEIRVQTVERFSESDVDYIVNAIRFLHHKFEPNFDE